MRSPLKRYQRRQVRRALDQNAGQLIRSLHHEPEDVDAREHLWEDRARLQRRWDAFHSLIVLVPLALGLAS